MDVGAAYLELSVWQQIAKPAALGDTIAWPPGYSKAVMLNLALEVADAFPNLKVSELLIGNAKDAKDKIQKLNLTNNIPVEDIPPAPPSVPATVQEAA